MRGPAPEPTVIKQMKGNPGKRALNDSEPQPSKVFQLPEPPESLGDAGERLWTELGPELIRSGLLTFADLPMFEALCLNYDLMLAARVEIAEKGMLVHGARGKVRNPAIAAFSAATSAIKTLGAEFGMSPSARSRIKLPEGDDGLLAGLLGGEGDDDLPPM